MPKHLALLILLILLSAAPAAAAPTVNLITDPGFEAGLAGFTTPKTSVTMSRTTQNPVEGTASLAIVMNATGDSASWSRSVTGTALADATRLDVSALVRFRIASASTLRLCAVLAYSDGGPMGQACATTSGATGDKGRLAASMTVDRTRPLSRIHLRVVRQGGAQLNLLLDSTVARLQRPDATPTPTATATPRATASPSPTATPTGTATYPGYDYTLPSMRPFISLRDFENVDRTSAAYLRFATWVDDAVVRHTPGYAYSARDSVILHRLTGDARYVDHAIGWVEAWVAEAEAEIAANHNPALAGDSYLEVGAYLEELSLTYDAGYDRLTPAQRTRWSAMAEQTLFNVWNPDDAHWGTRDAPWSGWSIDNPGNNYHFSFLRATMLWALASQNPAWFDFLQAHKFPPLVTYYDRLPGGGSREGTGYGTAQKNLFENYRMWEASTGENLARLTRHSEDTIDYWVHATVPTLNRFAPIGDQSRVSQPDLFDYQEQLVREAVIANRGTAAAARGVWWIESNSVHGMQNGFTSYSDLLATYDPPQAPTALAYHATGVGHFFARSSWTPSASWLAFVAGPYEESHAHQDQGSFTFYKQRWLAVTSNIWSHSGIEQGVAMHNVLRFVKNGAILPQNASESVASTMSYTEDSSGLHVTANLKNAYSRTPGIHSWVRALTFQGNLVRVKDTCSVAAGIGTVWQIHTPAHPVVQTDGSILAGHLRIKPVQPAAPAVNIVEMRTVNAEVAAGRWRTELRGGGCAYTVELRAE